MPQGRTVKIRLMVWVTYNLIQSLRPTTLIPVLKVSGVVPLRRYRVVLKLCFSMKQRSLVVTGDIGFVIITRENMIFRPKSVKLEIRAIWQ